MYGQVVTNRVQITRGVTNTNYIQKLYATISRLYPAMTKQEKETKLFEAMKTQLFAVRDTDMDIDPSYKNTGPYALIVDDTQDSEDLSEYHTQELWEDFEENMFLLKYKGKGKEKKDL